MSFIEIHPDLDHSLRTFGLHVLESFWNLDVSPEGFSLTFKWNKGGKNPRKEHSYYAGQNVKFIPKKSPRKKARDQSRMHAYLERKQRLNNGPYFASQGISSVLPKRTISNNSKGYLNSRIAPVSIKTEDFSLSHDPDIYLRSRMQRLQEIRKQVDAYLDHPESSSSESDTEPFISNTNLVDEDLALRQTDRSDSNYMYLDVHQNQEHHIDHQTADVTPIYDSAELPPYEVHIANKDIPSVNGTLTMDRKSTIDDCRRAFVKHFYKVDSPLAAEHVRVYHGFDCLRDLKLPLSEIKGLSGRPGNNPASTDIYLTFKMADDIDL